MTIAAIDSSDFHGMANAAETLGMGRSALIARRKWRNAILT